jgi:hypothetical protein
MIESKAAELLKTIFPDEERRFLLSHPKFKKAVALATDDCLFELGSLGMKLLKERDAGSN